MQNVRTFRIPAFGRVEIDSPGTIAFVSGDVPRLVVRDGSDSFDLLEGQSLPVTARTAYLCNPYTRDVVVAVSSGLTVRLGANAPQYDGRHFNKCNWQLTFNAYGAAANKRMGVGILPKVGRVEVVLQTQIVSPGVRYTTVTGADAAFMPLRPPAYMDRNMSVMDFNGNVSPDFIAMYGTYADADTSLWTNQAGYKVKLKHFSPTIDADCPGMQPGIVRMYADPTTAVVISMEQNYDFTGVLLIRELGLSAEDFD